MLPFTIGLTGGVGSGKSTVAKLFAVQGIEIIDADAIAHDLTSHQNPVLEQIFARFGDKIVNAERKLNRPALREIIFADASARKWLEELLHPLIRARMQKQATEALSSYCIQVIPLLNTRDYPHIQRILVVDTSEAAQIKRIIERDHLRPDQAQAMLNAQITREQRLAIADDTLMNDRKLPHLEQQVKKLHRLYLKLAERSIIS